MPGRLTKLFEVNIYYSSYCTYIVEAEDSIEAIIKARKLKINDNDILRNLENWETADTAESVT